MLGAPLLWPVLGRGWTTEDDLFYGEGDVPAPVAQELAAYKARLQVSKPIHTHTYRTWMGRGRVK